jgi:hypothetical protein
MIGAAGSVAAALAFMAPALSPAEALRRSEAFERHLAGQRGKGLFRGELWLSAESGPPLRFWGDLLKSPSIFVRSFRSVQDYQMVHGCTKPLRLLPASATRIAARVEMAAWLHTASEEPEATSGLNAIPNVSMEANRDYERNDR